jgi:hypothetical protein
MQTPTQHSTEDASVDRLMSFCRGEISAVESYAQALASGILARFSGRLRHCQSSHQTRVDLLRAQIKLLGGEPPTSSGAWGTFAKAVEKAATAAGERAALAILKEGEDHGLNLYRTLTADLDAISSVLVSQRLLPLQVETQRIASELASNPVS